MRDSSDGPISPAPQAPAAASIVFMFSGQASQFQGMGRELLDGDPTFRASMLRCNDVIEAITGRSALDALYGRSGSGSDCPWDPVTAHAGLFMVQWSLAQSLLSRGVHPTLLVGYSSGELVALASGGELALEEALAFACDQARLLERLCPAGSLAAVLQDTSVVDRFPSLFEECEVAAVNWSGHFVVAGPPPVVQRLRTGLMANGVPCQILPLPFGFHSSLVDAAEEAIAERAGALDLKPARIPLLSSTYLDTRPADASSYFWGLVRRPVRFDRVLSTLEASGPHLYLDVGPSGTLANFAKHGLAETSQSIVAPGVTPFESAAAALDRVARLLTGRSVPSRPV
jgi:acyl transferase domain-containing protein